MLQVLSGRTFTGKDPQKKSYGKTFYVYDLRDTESGNLAIDVFSPTEFPVGSYVDVKAAIYNHKLGYNLYQIMEKK